MPTAAKLEAVRRLIAVAPDAALRSLSAALTETGPDLYEVRTLIADEQAARTLRDAVLSPILPLLAPRADGLPAPCFSAAVVREAWRRVQETRTDEVHAAHRDIDLWDPQLDPTPRTFDALALAVAAAVEADASAGFVGADGGASARELAIYLKLTPLARKALLRLNEWLGRATEERAAVLRLIFKDATEVAPDSAPRLMTLIQAHLPEAWLILRPISLLTERAGDRYLASSELACFGEQLLTEVERRVGALRAFDLRGGAQAAREAAAHVALASAILAELEHSVDLARDGPWGRRAAAARTAMAAMIESRLREAQKMVEQALPMQAVRLTGRMTRPAPRVDAPPDPRLVEPARALLTLLGETRQAAASGGFGALRSQVAETLSDWLEVYADELVHLLNAGEARDPGVAHQYLEIAAEFLSCAENDKAAQIVRRRAAVAGAGQPSQDVA